MGNFWSRWINSIKKETRILMVGLDAAGKTSLLYKFKLGDTVLTTPTIGFNVETIEYRNLNMHVWDVGGQDRVRPLWRHYFSNVQAIIFVVDAHDRTRIDEAKEELYKILNESSLSDIPLLVYCNKQDLPASMTIAEISDIMDLHGQKRRSWYAQGSSAVTGAGVYEGMDWLAKICK